MSLSLSLVDPQSVRTHRQSRPLRSYGQQFADTLTRALGQPVSYSYVPPEVYRTFGFPGADEMGNMFQFNRDFAREFCAARDLAVTRSLNPELQTFAQWATANKDRIPLG